MLHPGHGPPRLPRCPGRTHVHEEEGHLELRDPPAHTLAHAPAKAQVPEVDEVLVFTQPSGWVKLARIEEEGGVLAHGIGGHLHQRLGTRWAEASSTHSLERNSAPRFHPQPGCATSQRRTLPAL